MCNILERDKACRTAGFIDIAFFVPTTSILVPVLPSISEAYSISPLVWIFLFVTAASSMFMAYQNMWVNLANSIAGDRGWEPAHLARFGMAYFIACLLATAVATSMFISMGLL